MSWDEAHNNQRQHSLAVLKTLGVSVVVYTNGESTVDVEKRWLYRDTLWPVHTHDHGEVRDADHTTWALHDAIDCCDVIHLNTAHGVLAGVYVNGSEATLIQLT